MTSKEKFSKYLNTYLSEKNNYDEFEVRFGTNKKNPITKIKFDNVIKKLKSLGFNCMSKDYHLNIFTNYVDSNTGKTKQSNIRTKINEIVNIQNYCATNTLNLEDPTKANYIKFEQKSTKKIGTDYLNPVDFDDFEFRINYKTERIINNSNRNVVGLLNTWNDSKKIFRLIKRFTFIKDDFPLQFDLSIIKSSKRNWVNGPYVPEYNIETSNVFKNPESYEIEIECKNDLCFKLNKETLMKQLRNSIKIILSGLQFSNYPVSYKEQGIVLDEYMKVIYGNKPDRKIFTNDFLGPSSISLEIIHTIPLSKDIISPNIRNPYTVTEKADGSRHLLFITESGKIYLINVNMDVIFTGCVSKNKKIYNSILDGELVENDKHGRFINYFLCFDIYILNNKNIMHFPFVNMEGLKYPPNMDKTIFRYTLLDKTIHELELVSITGSKTIPLTVKSKKFYKNTSETIFSQCNQILSKIDNEEFIYETDGLIFTPINMGVGSTIIGEKLNFSKSLKKTWFHSFKWKPHEFNTIDFLVTIKKDERKKDIIHSKFNEGKSLLKQEQIIKYKTMELRVGFDERNPRHGFLNPFDDIIQDNNPKDDNTINTYRAVPFQPTNPTPNFPVYKCNIHLNSENKMLIENGTESFEDKTIVEFKYDETKPKHWQWIPIRVRNDKTSDFRKGRKNFGNAYHVANSVWKSIHNPITERMIRTGQNIPTTVQDNDVYYKKNENKTITQSLRNFHNSVVKRQLILGVSKKGDKLIDMSVGKAGDFSKWRDANLSFVFGIDYSKDNIENRLDGACARYMKTKIKYTNIPKVIYLHGDSSKNIKNGDSYFDPKSKQISKAIFGSGPKDPTVLGQGVFKQYGKGEGGFNIVSNQFSSHYFFKSLESINQYIRNVSDCCAINGYFIGTCYDGKRVFNKLSNLDMNDSITIMDKSLKMWEIRKEYRKIVFNDDESSLGCQISVYQESINKYLPEFLVNFTYFTRLLENYGFRTLNQSELDKLKLPASIGPFSLLFEKTKQDIKSGNIQNTSRIRSAMKMNHNEKEISFLNNYFIYKKIRNVPTQSVFNSIVKNKKSNKTKFRKLKTKVKLVMQ